MREFPVHRKTQFPPSFVSLRKYKFVWERAGDWRLETGQKYNWQHTNCIINLIYND